MKKVVVNRCFGGFGLSHAAVMRYAEIKDIKLYPWLDDISRKVYGDKAVIGNDELVHHYSTEPVADEAEGWNDDNYWSDRDLDRDDPALVTVVEELGEQASGRHACLDITEIPDGVEWQIEGYDGNEHISEQHRTW